MTDTPEIPATPQVVTDALALIEYSTLVGQLQADLMAAQAMRQTASDAFNVSRMTMPDLTGEEAQTVMSARMLIVYAPPTFGPPA